MKSALIFLVSIIVFSGVNPFENYHLPADPGLVAKLNDFPLIDGSTSNQPLRQLIACEKLDFDCDWGDREEWEVEESIENFILPDFINQAVDVYYWFDGGNLQIFEDELDVFSSDERAIIKFWQEKLPNTKTHGAWVKLIEGDVDLIFTATKPSDDEMELAKEAGVEFETRAIALDAFVFIANAENPTDGLTYDQIRDIFSGKKAMWTDVNPNYVPEDEEILALARNRNSGSQEAMDKLVMKEIPMSPDLAPMEMPTMGGTINRVAEEYNSLCYTFYYYQQNIIPNPHIKLMSVDGIAPSIENIASKKYPFTTEVYATVRSDQDKNSAVYELFEWLLTDEGQEVIRKSGYVPLEM
jgi:phosphate transport system substrate-binding protein